MDLESQREVSTVEAMALAQQWSCPFVEVIFMESGDIQNYIGTQTHLIGFKTLWTLKKYCKIYLKG